ncbi:hypothetical protein MRX96_057759 [Rhipicephalus microplus]
MFMSASCGSHTSSITPSSSGELAVDLAVWMGLRYCWKNYNQSGNGPSRSYDTTTISIKSQYATALNLSSMRITGSRPSLDNAFYALTEQRRCLLRAVAVYGHLGARVALASVSSPVSCVIGGTCVDFLHGQPESIIGTAQLPGSSFPDKWDGEFDLASFGSGGDGWKQ